MLPSHSSPPVVTSWFPGLKMNFMWRILVHFVYRAANIKFHHLWWYLEKVRVITVHCDEVAADCYAVDELILRR
jgi:hypothetical protein